jgi:hypothetical protein
LPSAQSDTKAREAHIDAVDLDDKRYQIKGPPPDAGKPVARAGRNPRHDGATLDFLAGLLFDESFGVYRAALIPHAVVMERARFVARSNSHKFLLRDDIWDAPDVRNVTSELIAAARTLD